MLALAVDQEVVAVEDRVESAPQDPPGPDRDEPRPARGNDVKAFVGATAVARRAEFADRAARPVRTKNREDVAAIFDATRPGPSRCGSTE
jgi:hypothetical protein